MAAPDGRIPGSRRARLLEELFGVDLRSLALYRIAVAAALLSDCLDRGGDLVAHYTEAGALPVATVLQIYGSGLRVSPFFYTSGSAVATALLFALFAAATLALALGWRTRVAALLCWFLLVSVQIRNPPSAAMGGDVFLRVVLFWSLLLPLGARFSLDARRHRDAPAVSNRLVSLATAGLLFQVCVMYWATGLRKSGELWANGQAVFYALHMDIWATSLGHWLRERPELLPFLTHATKAFEVFGPFLAFVPVRTGPVRTLTVVAFAGFHVGLAMFLSIGPFPLYSTIAWLAFLPSWFWDTALPRVWSGARARIGQAGDALPRLRTPVFAQAAAAFLMLYVATTLANQVGALPLYGTPKELLARTGQVLRMYQSWRMFAPNPPTQETLPVFRGRLANGGSIDPLRREPVYTQWPELASQSLPSFRWRLYFAYLVKVGEPQTTATFYDALTHWLCRDWNAEHTGGERLRTIEVEHWLQATDRRQLGFEPRSVFSKRCSVDER